MRSTLGGLAQPALRADLQGVAYVIEHDDPTVLRCGHGGPLVYVATAVEVVGVARTPVGVILHLDDLMFQGEPITVFLDPSDARHAALRLLESADRVLDTSR